MDEGDSPLSESPSDFLRMSTEMLADKINLKYAKLQQVLASLESVIVAYSGGVDSSLVSAVAHHVLGTKRALIVTANSPSMAPYELDSAVALAAERGWNHRVVQTDEMKDERYTSNNGTRCFFCKTELYGQLRGMAREGGFAAIVNGANMDDLGDFRPGMKAATDFQVISPLVDADIAKSDVRLIAESIGLPNWDKPAQPCLSSRIPYGTHVTVAALRMIASAEKHLREMGFAQCRVRHYGNKARVELPIDRIDEYLKPDVKAAAEAGLVAAGYETVELDPRGFRSGSLNAALRANALGSSDASPAHSAH